MVLRGGPSMMPGCGGSTPSAMAGGPSMMMLTHNNCTGVKGKGNPRNGAINTVKIAPILVDS